MKINEITDKEKFVTALKNPVMLELIRRGEKLKIVAADKGWKAEYKEDVSTTGILYMITPLKGTTTTPEKMNSIFWRVVDPNNDSFIEDNHIVLGDNGRKNRTMIFFAAIA